MATLFELNPLENDILKEFDEIPWYKSSCLTSMTLAHGKIFIVNEDELHTVFDEYVFPEFWNNVILEHHDVPLNTPDGKKQFAVFTGTPLYTIHNPDESTHSSVSKDDETKSIRNQFWNTLKSINNPFNQLLPSSYLKYLTPNLFEILEEEIGIDQEDTDNFWILLPSC